MKNYKIWKRIYAICTEVYIHIHTLMLNLIDESYDESTLTNK